MKLLRKVLAFMGRTDGSLQHKALRSGIWVALTSFWIALLNFGRGVVLAWLLAPEVFGLMAVCLMATRLIDIFTETGFNAALVHRKRFDEDTRDTAFTLGLMRGVGLALFSAVIAPFVAAFYEQPILTWIVPVVGLNFILMGAQNINVVTFQKELDFKRLAYLELTGSVLRFVASVGFAIMFRSIWALVLAQVAAGLITSLLSFVMVPIRTVRLRFNVQIAKELYGYGRFITGLAIVVFFTRELDNALIGKLLGMDALGFYVVAYSLANLPADYLSRFIARVLFPMFSKLQGDAEALRAEYSRGIRTIMTLMVPVSVAMAVLAPEIVQALYGERWSRVAAPLRVLAVFGCMRALWLLNGYLYNAIGKPHIDFYMNLTRLIVMCALLYPLTTMYGPVGAAIAVTLPMVLQFCIGVYLSRRFIGAPASMTLRALGLASAQAALVAVVLLAAKQVIHVDARIAVPLLLTVAGAICLALNRRDIRALMVQRS